MLKNYIVVTIRGLIKNKGFSLINISGLSIGMATFILILIFVRYEFGFEMFHENINKIYQVTEEQKYKDRTFSITATPAPMAEAMKKDFPEIISATRLAGSRKTLVRYENNAFYETMVVFTDAATFEIFTFPFVIGDKNNIFDDPYTAVLTEDIAKKYFGSENPLGKTLNIDNKFIVTVTGVIKNIPENSSFN